ncbi:MAG TPA: hypothetical protein VKU01_08925 [Bryobacteraceae bacterium]|nr:hypothetical protein [Bryobacteraceae bacterium]
MRCAILLLLVSCFPVSSLAQAWLSAQGDGTVSVLYQYGIDRLHSFDDGRTKDKGHIFSDAVLVNTDFSFTDRLAVSVGLPFIAAQYVGGSPHLLVRGDPSTAVAVDNGDFHGGFQDFTLNVRYAVTKRRALKIAPLFQVTVPSHQYPSFGHASIGLDEKEYRVGVNVGRRLDPILPRAFVQAQYAFGMSPEIAAGVAPKRSYGELQLGYLLNRHISFEGSTVIIYSHNGILSDYNLFPNNLTVDQYLNHDRIAKVTLVDAGVSIGYQLNRSTNFFVSVGHSYYGTNTHLRFLVTTVGFTKAFSTRLSAENSAANAVLQDSRKAVVCTCAKSK